MVSIQLQRLITFPFTNSTLLLDLLHQQWHSINNLLTIGADIAWHRWTTLRVDIEVAKAGASDYTH
jgi:hypothetical protein